jgi:hypothetical protein
MRSGKSCVAKPKNDILETERLLAETWLLVHKSQKLLKSMRLQYIDDFRPNTLTRE